MASEIAVRFAAPLDVVVVRKLGLPGHEELAMGAVASGGVVIPNETVVVGARIGESTFQRAADAAQAALTRLETEFRGERASTTVECRNVILVDDGLATGSTMKAAIAALRDRGPESIMVAVPVAPADTLSEISRLADDVVCLVVPTRFVAVGLWYREFSQVSTLEVRRLLKAHPAPTPD